jgi:hypothetical protein
MSGSEENSTIPDDNSDIDASLSHNAPNKRRASFDLNDEFHPQSFLHMNVNMVSKAGVLDAHGQHKGPQGTRSANPGMCTHTHHHNPLAEEDHHRYMHDAFDIDFDYPSTIPVAPLPVPGSGPWEKQLVPQNEPDEWTEVLSLFGQSEDHDWAVPTAAGASNTGTNNAMPRSLSTSSLIL